MSMKNFPQDIKIVHFLGALIFLVAMGIRLSAIHNIYLTNHEAAYLFSLVNPDNKFSFPFLQQVIIRSVFSFSGENFQVARVINVLLGSLLVICPFLFKKYLGIIGAVILAAVLSLDPFFIVNSTLVNGQTLVMLLVTFSIAYLLKRKYLLALFLMFLVFLSVQAFSHFFFISVSLVVFGYASKKISVPDIGWVYKNLVTEIRKNLIYFLAGILATFVIAALYGINLASIHPDTGNFLGQAAQGYTPDSSPFAYLITFISYLPLFFVILPASIYMVFVQKSEKMKFVLFWMVISVLIVFYHPGHQLIDLLWVSLPVWIAFAYMLSEGLKSGINFCKNDKIMTVILLVMLVSLSLFLLSIVNRIGFGGNVTGQILSIISVLTISLVAIILYAYIRSVKYAARILAFCILIMGMTMQVAIAARSAGFNQRPQYETLWEGYFPDQDIFLEIAEKSRYKQLGTGGNLDVAFLTEGPEAPQWLLREAGYTVEHVWTTEGLNNPIIITEWGELEDAEKVYNGQKFVRSSFPLWLFSPRENVLSHDYWSWFFFRQSILFNEYNYVWIRTEIERAL